MPLKTVSISDALRWSGQRGYWVKHSDDKNGRWIAIKSHFNPIQNKLGMLTTSAFRIFKLIRGILLNRESIRKGSIMVHKNLEKHTSGGYCIQLARLEVARIARQRERIQIPWIYCLSRCIDARAIKGQVKGTFNAVNKSSIWIE